MSSKSPNDWGTSHDSSTNSEYVLRKDVESSQSEHNTIEVRREIIMKKLETSYPIITTILFGAIFSIIGLSGISLQIGLIVNKAVNYQVANGIWGGFFALLNGLIKFNMVRTQSYTWFIINRSFTLPIALLTSIGLTLVSGINLRQYAKCDDPFGCSIQNQNITIAMLVLGVCSLFLNLIFRFAFHYNLYGGFRKAKGNTIGMFETFSELMYVLFSKEYQIMYF